MRIGFKIAGILLPVLIFAISSIAADKKQPPAKPLSGYSSIVVSNVDVDKNPATVDFPSGLERFIQSQTVKDLREKRVFAEVIDASDSPPAAQKQRDRQPNQIILTTTVLSYDKGSRAARAWVGFGAGQSRMKVTFAFRDAGTDAEMLHFDEQGTYKGIISTYGGSQDEAFLQTSRDLLKNLIKEIESNR